MRKDFDSVGRPVPAAPGHVAHEYRTHATGERITVVRDARGRFLPGHRMADTRDPATLGAPVKHAESALLRSLGLPVNTWRKK